MYCEPYQSCSLFGSIRMIANLKNVVSIIHGPTGCSFFARNSIIRLNGYYSARHRIPVPIIYSTDFNENDTIFGGVDKLKRAINEIVLKDKPEAIFLFNCCVSEVIGEDIDTVAEDASNKYHIPIIPIHSAGFKGDHKVGMKMGNEVLFDYFIKNQDVYKSRNRINILGDYDYFNRSSTELRRIIGLMKEKEVFYIPGNSSIEELKQASSAALNIITCKNASKHLANRMQEEYDIPFIGGDSNLYGIDVAFETYEQIFDFFDEDKKELIQIRDNAKQRLYQKIPLLEGCRAVVVAGTRRAMGYSSLLKEMGIEIEFIFTESFEEDIRSELNRYSKNIMCDQYPIKLFERIDELKPDFIFSTLPELVAPNKYVYRNDEDYAGFEGVIKLADYLLNIKQKEESVFVRMEN